MSHDFYQTDIDRHEKAVSNDRPLLGRQVHIIGSGTILVTIARAPKADAAGEVNVPKCEYLWWERFVSKGVEVVLRVCGADSNEVGRISFEEVKVWRGPMPGKQGQSDYYQFDLFRKPAGATW